MIEVKSLSSPLFHEIIFPLQKKNWCKWQLEGRYEVVLRFSEDFINTVHWNSVDTDRNVCMTFFCILHLDEPFISLCLCDLNIFSAPNILNCSYQWHVVILDTQLSPLCKILIFRVHVLNLLLFRIHSICEQSVYCYQCCSCIFIRDVGVLLMFQSTCCFHLQDQSEYGEWGFSLLFTSVIDIPREWFKYLYGNVYYLCSTVRVWVTLQLTVGQYVLVSSPLCGRLTRYCFRFKSFGWNLLSCLCGVHTLTRSRVCPLQVTV
jgi:hypothetical protein